MEFLHTAEVTIFHCIIASFILFHSLHGGSINASQFKAELTINRLGRKINSHSAKPGIAAGKCS